MTNIKYETQSGMSLFKGDILDSFILHIPHSSTHIPNLDEFALDKIEENINILTDWETDKIFDIDGIERIITPYSRLFCDVERFEDENEPMFNVGRGFYYTHGDDGSILRNLDENLKKIVYEDYYLTHHKLLYDKVTERLDKYGICYIIDCHSFSGFPDICIGTDPFHTPDYLLNYAFKYFANAGYSVEINNPYSGCIIPKPYFMKNNKVKGIMIEINKRLYMNDDMKIAQLRDVITTLFNNL